MALILCQDLSSHIGKDHEINIDKNSIDPIFTSNILQLHNCGIQKFVFVVFEECADFLEALMTFFRCFLPECILQFLEEKNVQVGMGDVILSKQYCFEKEDSFLVVSWRNIPEFSILKGFIDIQADDKSTLVLASAISSQTQSYAIPYQISTDKVVEESFINNKEDIGYASDCGVYLFRTHHLSNISTLKRFISPQSPIDLLHLINQTVPNEVTLVFSPISQQTRSISISFPTFTISEGKKIRVFADGVLSNCICNDHCELTVHCNSTLRYLYGIEDERGNIDSFEKRGIPREVYISRESSQLEIVDSKIDFHPSFLLCHSNSLLFINLERWRKHSNLRFLSTTPSNNEKAFMMKCTSNTILYHCSNEQLCDISISIEDCITKKQYSLVLREDEIAAVATNLSIVHNDGIILKEVDGMEIELKLVVVQSLPRKSIDYSILSSYSQLYHLHSSPLLVGHRGCGVNALPHQEITENTIESFTQAYHRGLSTIECDLQLSEDHSVIIFHDYTLSDGTPIASLSSKHIQSHSLSPTNPSLHIPTIQELFTLTPPGLDFNLEVKYPMITELSLAQLNVSKNEYTSKIITSVENMHSSRKIYYSSFDADVCIHLLYKQAKYPVFLLLDDNANCPEITKEEWKKSVWKTYVKLVLERGKVRGVVAAVSLLDESSVRWLHSLNLLVYCWGNEGNYKNKRDQLKSMGVDAIIADTFEN